VTGTLAPGEQVSIVQDNLFNHGAREDHFLISAGKPGSGKKLKDGTRAGGWISAETKEAGATLVLRDLWEQYPQGPAGWSRRPFGPLLDHAG
jgi:hypothetical protein